jgi:hypothetical protein
MMIKSWQIKVLNRLFPQATRINHCTANTVAVAAAATTVIPNAAAAASSGKNENVVLLLGWSGSQQKHFNKLVREYDSLGMSTVTFIMPPAIPLFARDWLEAYVAKLLKEEMHLTPASKFVVHSYSNNGMWVFSSLMDQGLMRAPNAFISDAAPKFWYEALPHWDGASALSRVFVAIILNKNVYEHPVLTPLLSTTFATLSILNSLLLSVQGKRRIVMDTIGIHGYARNVLPFPPSLFIYSSGDQLVPPEFVKEFTDALRARGISVEEKQFGDNVAHTGSFFADNKAYMNTVKEFLKKNRLIPSSLLSNE